MSFVIHAAKGIAKDAVFIFEREILLADEIGFEILGIGPMIGHVVLEGTLDQLIFRAPFHLLCSNALGSGILIFGGVLPFDHIEIVNLVANSAHFGRMRVSHGFDVAASAGASVILRLIVESVFFSFKRL